MNICSEDPEVFRTVYERVFPKILRVSYNITLDADIAEDICQEAFIKFYHHTAPFPSIDQATYWLLRVVKNLSLNYFKRRKRERKAMESYFHQPQPLPKTGEEEILRSETAHIVQQAVSKLPDSLKSVIVLKEFGDLSYSEIAQVLQISENNVKVRVHRARTKLEKSIEEEDVHV
ncbi:MAG: RNA polymerase sigma factor [Spirochaetaceae bacterium]